MGGALLAIFVSSSISHATSATEWVNTQLSKEDRIKTPSDILELLKGKLPQGISLQQVTEAVFNL
jgi:hypothetical protein